MKFTFTQTARVRSLFGLLIMLLMGGAAYETEAQTTLHYWHFNTAPSGGLWPTTSVAADVGSGTLSNDFVTQADDFGGTTINVEPAVVAGTAYCPLGGTALGNNSKAITLSLPTNGYEDVVLTYATQRTASGFTTQQVDYSTDGGTTYINIINITPPGAFALQTISFAAIPAADNNPNFRIRIKFSGATNATGNNRLDNIKLQGNPLSGTSTITAGAGAEPATISSLVTSSGMASLNFDFTINDDGATPATDALPFLLSNLVIKQGTGNDVLNWSQAIAGCELSSGVTTVTGTVNTNNLTFASIPCTGAGDLGYVADNASKTYTLKIWLKAPLDGTLPLTIDGMNFVFLVDNSSVTTAAGSSTLATGQTQDSGATNNEVTVIATEIRIVVPSCVVTGSTFNAAVSVTDIYGNVDRNYTSTATLSLASGPGSLTGTLSQPVVLGVASYTDLVIDTDGTYTIQVNDGTYSQISASFNVQPVCSCIEVESILVDACSTPEGANEMFLMEVNQTMNVSDIVIDWPNNSFLGFCQDATTASIVANINTTITAGGFLFEPVGGVIPAGTEVMVISSTAFCWTCHDWSMLNYPLCVIFQCPGNTSGHFKNFDGADATPRTLTVTSASCPTETEAVSFTPNALYNGDGAQVDFTTDGTATYGSAGGCVAPVLPLPVRIAYLIGNEENGSHFLRWATSYEEGIEQFVLQISSDGKSFSDLTSLPSLGTRAGINQYAYTYAQSNAMYYRVKAVESTGLVSYSSVVHLGKDLGLSVQLYPNPSKGQVNLVLGGVCDCESLQLKVYASSGVELGSFEGSIEEVQLSLEKLVQKASPGIYFVKVLVDGKVSSARLIRE